MRCICVLLFWVELLLRTQQRTPLLLGTFEFERDFSLLRQFTFEKVQRITIFLCRSKWLLAVSRASLLCMIYSLSLYMAFPLSTIWDWLLMFRAVCLCMSFEPFSEPRALVCSVHFLSLPGFLLLILLLYDASSFVNVLIFFATHVEINMYVIWIVRLARSYK